jgi:hypothetical protein
MTVARHGITSVAIAVAIFLAGCANEHQADAQAKEDQAAAAQASRDIGSIDDARCQSFGFPRATPAYSRCRRELDRERSHIGIKE